MTFYSGPLSSPSPTIDIVTILSMVVTPALAAPGTSRTITVISNSSESLVLNAVIASMPAGIVFTPVGGQPPGTFVWTFTY